MPSAHVGYNVLVLPFSVDAFLELSDFAMMLSCMDLYICVPVLVMYPQCQKDEVKLCLFDKFLFIGDQTSSHWYMYESDQVDNTFSNFNVREIIGAFFLDRTKKSLKLHDDNELFLLKLVLVTWNISKPKESSNQMLSQIRHIERKKINYFFSFYVSDLTEHFPA